MQQIPWAFDQRIRKSASRQNPDVQKTMAAGFGACAVGYRFWRLYKLHNNYSTIFTESVKIPKSLFLKFRCTLGRAA
jgi:hypothetical protein